MSRTQSIQLTPKATKYHIDSPDKFRSCAPKKKKKRLSASSKVSFQPAPRKSKKNKKKNGNREGRKLSNLHVPGQNA